MKIIDYLINEYKEKNDTLSGLVNKYQAYANENEEIKQTLSLERDQFETKIKEITNQSDNQKNEIKELKQQLQLLKDSHVIELERINEKRRLRKR